MHSSSLGSRHFLALGLLSVLPLAQLEAQTLMGDEIATNSGSLIVHPISHATFAMSWNGITIYNDPVGGAAPFEGLPAPDLIIISDIHGDHLDVGTLETLAVGGTRIVAPAAAAEQLPDGLRELTTILANGSMTEMDGIGIEAIPMYNLSEDRRQFHSKGRGNGYVLDFAGTRVYISGDTEDIPEMRALEDIDVAFVCFNLPYTMTEEQAASAVLEFAPDVVYPYHYRGSDIDEFERLVAADDDIEVRRGAWY